MSVNRAKEAILEALAKRGLDVVAIEGDALRFSEGEGEVEIGLAALGRIAEASTGEQLALFVDARIDTALERLRSDPRPMDLDRLVIRLRPPSDSPDAPWSRPIAGGRLCLCLVEDGPEVSRYLGPMDLVQTGRSVDALIRVGHLGVVSAAPQGRWIPVDGMGSAVRSAVGDGNDGARFLVAEHWIPDPRGVVGLVPSRGACFAIPASDPDVLGIALALREVAVSIGDSSAHPISGEVFWSHGGVVHHLPVRGRGADARFESLPAQWGD